MSCWPISMRGSSKSSIAAPEPAPAPWPSPRFTTRYEAQQLKDDLAAMGMPRAFSPAEAEF